MGKFEVAITNEDVDTAGAIVGELVTEELMV